MNYQKMTPALNALMHDFEHPRVGGLSASLQSFGIVQTDATADPSVVVKVRIDDKPETVARLAKIGVTVNEPTRSEAGRKNGYVARTAYLPISALGSLSDDPSVRRISPGRYLNLLLDTAAVAVNLPAYKAATGDTGKGVVVGIVDSGLDCSHPAFAGRVLRVWDQTLAGAGVPGRSYGTEFVAPTFTGTTDTHGHGTHVAGIAAGNDATYQGVAHEANIVFVKTTMMDAHIADGVEYIFDVAASLGLPAVVNLSLGGHHDPHDGTDDLSHRIDLVSGPQRIVVCAAGNEGSQDIHAHTSIAPSGADTINFGVANPAMIPVLNGWYPGTFELEIAVESPSGLMTPFQGVILAGSPSRIYPLTDGTIRMTTNGPDPVSGDHNFFVEVLGASPLGQVAAGVWKLHVRRGPTAGPAGDLHIWSMEGHNIGQVPFVSGSGVPGHKVGSPGASGQAVTVACLCTKNSWTDATPAPQSIPSLTVGGLAFFSSDGPLRNGAQKPDFTAPGAVIASAMSSASLPLPKNRLLGGFTIMMGTSMAAPFVTGLVALLLQKDPTLDPAGVKAKLKARSAIPGGAPGAWDAHWGYGIIDMATP
ncbi:S8 family serine peptidase [Fimbriimonas ginsengisoli]|uniref:Peptidase S8/S53 subtilisin kexin sedolisin n=1 Tax=Fimbriimonas ginsengisoli Gsoil 348 TaxID=661478 RepID=A0A068NLT0_FIMGI|nr:S8 family serine peptidase [Fimbriimonas ginsengisoli]AIE84431.1 peptidase S8/S53 subtilisin kexin sedolisin [Fimbriimonas ginsengisoli Gsoil 348]